MAQRRANYETDCTACMTYIAQDDPVWFDAMGRPLCRKCADKQDRICPRCEGTKLPTSDVCANCNKKRGFTSALGFGGIGGGDR